MIIITHIGKTGGTSFRGYLEQSFGTRLFMDYPIMPWAGIPKWRWALSWLTGERGPVPRGVECIIGHFRATKYDQLFPQALHGVWLRDPVQRVASHYHHVLRNQQDRRKQRKVREEGLSLAEFAQQRWSMNVQTRALRHKPLTDFAFVGITEHFDIGLQLFSRIFDLPAPKPAPRRNENPERKAKGYDIDPEVHELIRQINAPDAELYEQGTARFRALCQQFGLTLPEQRAA